MNELLCKKHTPRLGHGDGGRSKMLNEQSPEVPLADAKTFCQRFDARAIAVKSAFGNERKRTRYRVRSSAP